MILGHTEVMVDAETDVLLRRVRDLMTANVMWSYLLEVAKADQPVTLRVLRDVADGVSTGALPDLSLVMPDQRVQLPYGSLTAA